MVRSRRSAFTLFETVLVMMVLVIVAGVCYPSIKGMYGSYKLNGAVDSVRSAWAEARSRAISEGRPYRFSVEPNGSHYRVAPDSPDYWPGSGSGDDPNGKGMVLEKALPAGVHFNVSGDSKGPPPDPPSNSNDEKERPATGTWNTGVVFLPDGSAKDDVKITFQVRGARPTALQLRGLTGNVSVQVVKQ
jgi:type II secretory pathway pseudopilin PulG